MFRLGLAILLIGATFQPLAAKSQCANAIACENALTGNSATEWAITEAGDTTIQGYGTDMSVNKGQTITFKISTDAKAYTITIYRIGYYGGMGARKIATITPSAKLPQTQPQCLKDAATGMIDCGNWAISASWPVPSTAVSGVYIARLVRTDTGGASHIIFIVRDDASTSDLLFQTSDTAWLAYNSYGGASLYTGNGPGTGGSSDGRSFKVSYNRPFNDRAGGLTGGQSNFSTYFFSNEYPMVRWLESNGYNVTYAAGVDTDRRGAAPLKQHKVFLSVGHDEYWSGGQRANVEAARAAGVNLAFFSGNEVFWKTRWENSIDGTNTTYRTMACYKETHANAKIDPTSAWTGTWRDPRFSPPGDGGRPENALTGQIFTVNAYREDAITVSAAEGKQRFWRNTGLQTLGDNLTSQLPRGVLGDEWDECLDNGYRPGGLIYLSSTTINPVNAYLQDYGSNYLPGTGTHHLTLYRHSSGALVFGAGTIRYSWGLDATHDNNITNPPGADVRMQQATLNLFADMGVQPTTMRPGLVAAAKSTDTTAPASAMGNVQSLTVPAWGLPITLSGIATDLGGGRPAAVELSSDGGVTWHPATGAANWSALWTPGNPGVTTIQSRAIDDSLNIENPSRGITVTVVGNSARATLWTPDVAPISPDLYDPTPSAQSPSVELGVQFKSDLPGYISALRFYKSPADTGAHTGSLWSTNGALLGTVAYTNETPSGWQEAKLPNPVSITPGTSYVASYHSNSGHHPGDANYFQYRGVDRGPLHSPRSSATEPNGHYIYGPSAYPANSYSAANYWIDVVYTNDLSADTTPPVVSSEIPLPGASGGIDPFSPVAASFNEPVIASTVTTATFQLRDNLNNLVAANVTYFPDSSTVVLQPSAPLNPQTTYTAIVKGGASGVSDLAGNRLANDFTWSFTTSGLTIWPHDAVPVLADTQDQSPVELGVRFKSDVDGYISALRFYKSPANLGPHVGNLWSNDGTLLSSVTFTNESISGWQEMPLPAPIPIRAGINYVASYNSPSNHAGDVGYFASQGTDRGTLHAVQDIAPNSNGLYLYGTGGFPSNSSQSANYWVDVSFAPTNQANIPTFFPGGGTYAAGQTVLLSTSIANAQIYYTTNGSTPTTSSTKYVAPIVLTASSTIRAIAVAIGWSSSPVASASYTIQTAQSAGLPSFSPSSGTYSYYPSITISSPGATIYYTTDGSTPSTSSSRYTGPVAISAPTNLKAIAVLGSSNSGVASSLYSFQAAAPVISPSGGSYSNPLSITLTDTTSGSKIYYTTNGTTPTTSSSLYTAAFTVSATTTVNAIAAVSGWANSAVTSAAYIFPTTTAPTAPSSLTAMTVSATQINLAWTDNANNEAGFKIERKTGSSGTYTQIATVGANVTTYNDTTVSASTTYYYRVRATNAIGDSAYSNEVSVNTSAPPVQAPWSDADIGTTGLAGSASFLNNVFTAKGAGADIWGTADAFHFVSQTVSGDCEIIARVASLQNTDPWAKGGVMIRESANANSTQALIAITPGNGFAFQRRTTTGGSSVNTTGPSGTAPSWVRLVRSGNTFSAYSSSNGSTWTLVGTDTIAMATTFRIGMAVTSHTTSALCTATFDNVAVNILPAAPASLTATAATTSQINLAWNDVSGETGFKIERKTGSSGTYAQIATVGANVTSYIDTGLTASTTYYYRVRATNTVGDSAYSNEANATTSAAIPSAPASLSATPTSYSQINLSWTNVANETGYKIERKLGVSGTYAQIATTGADVTTFSDTALAPLTNYYYRVRATNAAGDSSYSPEAIATTLSQVPLPPASLSATTNSTTQITLSWSNVASETGYKIERKDGAPGSGLTAGGGVTAFVSSTLNGSTTYTEIATVGADVTTFVDNTLTANTTYSYRVRATNSFGDSDYSPEASNTTFDLPPASPSGLAATTVSYSQINLSWTDNSGNETGFKVERKTGASGTYAQIGTVAANVTSYSSTGLSSATTYYYRIRATNAGGDSAYSAEVSATTANGIPAAPANLTATATSSSQINLSWSDVANETGFKIERKTGASGTYAQIATVGANVTTYNNTGLTIRSSYYYRVRATNAVGDSAYSNEANATTIAPGFRAAASAATKSGVLTLTVNKPSGTIAGDVMIAAVAVRPSTATVTATGWTLIRRSNNTSGNSNSLAVYSKVAGASEPASYSFTFNTSTGAVGGIQSFANIDNANPIDVEAGQNTASSTTITAPSVTARYAGDMLLSLHAFATSATFAPPSGMTEAIDISSETVPNTGGEGLECNYQSLTAIGATGTRSAVASNDADTGNAQTIALKAK